MDGWIFTETAITVIFTIFIEFHPSYHAHNLPDMKDWQTLIPYSTNQNDNVLTINVDV